MNSYPNSLASTGRASFRRLGIVSLGLLILLVSQVSGQPPDDRKPTNLKVLDSTMSREQVMGVMRQFTQALGVGCDHCHVRPTGNQREPDFASDDNKIKLTARAMFQMVNQINNTSLAHLPAVSDTPRVTVQCMTCHHGQPRPLLIQDILKKVRKDQGMTALDSTYRDLRKQYYGSFAYDFSDQSLAQLALEVVPESNPDAFALLNLNKEFNPKSYINEWAMGRVYVAKADTASAIAAFKRALEINPDFRRAQRELQMLGVKP